MNVSSTPIDPQSTTRPRKLKWMLVIALSLFVLPLAAQAQYVYQSDGGYFDLRVDRDGKVPKQKIFWVWAPHFNPGDATYEIFAWCTRTDVDGNFVGKNKIIFQNIRLVGDGVSLSTKKLVKKLKNGEHAEFLTREISSLALVAASSDTVIGEATVAVKGKLKAFDRLFCHIDVTESPA